MLFFALSRLAGRVTFIRYPTSFSSASLPHFISAKQGVTLGSACPTWQVPAAQCCARRCSGAVGPRGDSEVPQHVVQNVCAEVDQRQGHIPRGCHLPRQLCFRACQPATGSCGSCARTGLGDRAPRRTAVVCRRPARLRRAPRPTLHWFDANRVLVGAPPVRPAGLSALAPPPLAGRAAPHSSLRGPLLRGTGNELKNCGLRRPHIAVLFPQLQDIHCIRWDSTLGSYSYYEHD